ncbi:hypothetical protein [Lentilactobacillus kisonensis]|uniref:Uncharacterized protein n=1 Tax=Lentilactobacillus kisonensis DSM 19906 = JCM 15041 TaxID=1423766 RepID=A0A0R1NSC7_9LACO|nr:hypothetical protein [Lentilactobacillus kisonensis]KRL23007.1 hypothetical protein FC98_GL001038 [Lentilactobacillus kisonensis DSM 19906 = JCM 15041]
MKIKTIIATALLTAGFGLGITSTTANASVWHKGTPGFLRNTFYRTKLSPKYVKLGNRCVENGNAHRYEGFKTYRTQIKFYGYQYGVHLKGCRYKHSGHIYLIEGKYQKSLEANPLVKVTRVNGHVIYANAGEHFSGGHYVSKLEKMTRIY